MLGLLALLVGTRLGFGFERPPLPGAPLGPDPENYHHEGITRAGAANWAGGPGSEMVNSIAFHCDYVDSYNYNPLWWARGLPSRVEVAMSTQHLLGNLHFDDLPSTVEIEATYRRYMSGAVCGLLWAYGSDIEPRLRISCAHNIIGSGLHAIQDFYSHSNWIDLGVHLQSRRETTWFEADDKLRHSSELYTGYYEQAPQHGHKPHGTYEFACSIIKNLGLGGDLLREVVCHAASPLSKSSLCRAVRRCESAVPVRIPIIGELRLPKGIAYVSPGINVDSRWQAGVAVQNRDLQPPIGPNDLFDIAYNLAARATCQWLNSLDKVMEQAAQDCPLPKNPEDENLLEWWSAVKSTGVSVDDYKSDTAPFERFDLMPYQFLAAGPYPPPADDEEKWYLRLVVTTGSDDQANTNASIVPEIDGVRLEPLDYGPRPTGSAVDATIGYNDFTRMSTAAYMIGPLDTPPWTVLLHNTAPSFVDVLEAIVEETWELLVDVINWIGGLIGSLLGLGADFVATNAATLRAADLDQLMVGEQQTFSIDCDGKSEGYYRVNGTAKYLSDGAAGPKGYPTRRYRVNVSTLHCVRESAVDGLGSNSDEPFVVGLVIGHGSRQQFDWRTRVFDDHGGVDTGDTRAIDQSFEVDIPRKFGLITVPVAVWEHDEETSSTRADIQHEFAVGMHNRLEPRESSLWNTIGESMGQAWQLHAASGTAFRRGPEATVIEYLPQVMDAWVDGGESSPAWHPLERSESCSVPVPTRLTGCGGAHQVPDPPTIEEHANPDSDPDGEIYRPGMFDNGD